VRVVVGWATIAANVTDVSIWIRGAALRFFKRLRGRIFASLVCQIGARVEIPRRDGKRRGRACDRPERRLVVDLVDP